MASYLLLRNNKESGPYTLEALIQLGLKPYDLVWLQGKSAAWRYPSEMEDLKFYAPAVEEQPFDRFYKRPSDLKKEQEEKKKTIVQEIIQPVVTEAPIQKIQETIVQQEEEKLETDIPKKQVYVSLPANGGKTVIIKKTEQVAAIATNGNGSVNDSYTKKPETFSSPEPVNNSYSPSYSELVSDYNKQQYTDKKANVENKALPIDEDDAPLEKKYSQSLDDMKDIYAQNLADRKRKNAQRKMITDLAKKVLPFAAVLIVGILVGVFIDNDKSGNNNTAQTQQSVVAKQAETVTTPKTDIPDNKQAQQPVSTAPQTDLSQQSLAENKQANLPSVTEKNTGTSEQQGALSNNNKKTIKKDIKQSSVATNNSTALTQPKSVEADPVTGERNKVVRSDNENNAQTQTKQQVNNSLARQVSVASNDYKRGTFGGIHDLQLTVTNNSNYLLDNVIVELQILKPNDQPLKTDNIRFSPVPPNGSLTLAMPATSRGVKVAYKVVHVESKSAVNDTAGLK